MSIAEHNLAMIHHVAMRLGDLVETVVFLGGATTTLLITDTAAGDVRPTKDVDVIAVHAKGTGSFACGKPASPRSQHSPGHPRPKAARYRKTP